MNRKKQLCQKNEHRKIIKFKNRKTPEIDNIAPDWIKFNGYELTKGLKDITLILNKSILSTKFITINLYL